MSWLAKLIWFFCFLAYHPSWVIKCRNILVEAQLCHYVIYSWEDKKAHAFPVSYIIQKERINWLRPPTSYLKLTSRLGLENTPTASLQRGTPLTSVLDIKQNNLMVSGMLDLRGIRSTHLLSSLPGPLWPGIVTTLG